MAIILRKMVILENTAAVFWVSTEFLEFKNELFPFSSIDGKETEEQLEPHPQPDSVAVPEDHLEFLNLLTVVVMDFQNIMDF